MTKHLPMAIDTSIPFNQCQFKLFNVDNNSLFCRDLLVEVNHKLIESTIAYFLGLDITKVEEMAVANIDLNYAYARNRMFGLTLDQVQQLFATTDNPVANKYRPILSELIFTQVLPLFNQQPKHDDFKKEIDMNIITTNQPLTMSSLEISELCDKEHRNVMRDIKNMLEQLQMGALNFEHTYINPQNGQTYPCYNLNKELSLTLVAGYNVKLRHKIILRWQELEDKTTPAIPQTYSAALLEAAKLAEQSEKLQLELKHKDEMLEEAKPLIEFAETAQKAASGILIRDLAYLAQNDGIKIGEKRLWTWFRTMGFIHQRSRRPMQEYIERGYFVMQPTFVHHNSGMQEHFTTKITGKGQVYFLNKLKDFFNLKGQHEQNNSMAV